MTIRHTERSLVAKVAEIINNAARELGLQVDAEGPDAEIVVGGRRMRLHAKFPDLVVRIGGRVAAVIEFKRPSQDPWDLDLVDDVFGKAGIAGARFAGTCNFRELHLWDVERKGTLYDKYVGRHRLAEIEDLQRFKALRPAFEASLRALVQKLYALYTGAESAPRLPLDEVWIARLRAAVDAFFYPVFAEVKRLYEDRGAWDSEVEWRRFREGLRRWFQEQVFAFLGRDEDFERVARQYVYLLINKLLFYNALRAAKPQLPKLSLEDVTDGRTAKERLQTYFDAAVKAAGFPIIFKADFLDAIPIPDGLLEELRLFVEWLNKHDFSKLPYEVVGRVFEGLIPREERHKLGQYFTRSDVVDLILGFTVRDPDATVFDPACGAGTFLIRAYSRKRWLARRAGREKAHEELLRELWGNDIARFPAHLAAINLATRDLQTAAEPRVVENDSFDLKPGGEARAIRTGDVSPPAVRLPREFDAVVTNPPYTRQEEMEDIFKGLKEKAAQVVEEEWGMRVGGRSSIYFYFFLHGGAFLRPGRRLGLVTSNSWLDADYGRFLQEFFLRHFRLVAVIESKVERWFEDAAINTAITIAERCERERCGDENLVKFVQLKRPLTELIPPTDDEDARWEAVERLVELIEGTSEYYEGDKIRIFPVRQGDLWREGFNEGKGEYLGSKWGKYIRAPDIFYWLLDRMRERGFVRLGDIAEIQYGIKSGADKFFYLTEEKIRRLCIEQEFWMHPLRRDEPVPSNVNVWKDPDGRYFKQTQYAKIYKLEDVLRDDGSVWWIPNYLIQSSRELQKYVVDPAALRYRVLLVYKDKQELRGTNMLKHIEEGEAKGFHKRPTCSARRPWYSLRPIYSDIVVMKYFDDRFPIFYNEYNCLFKHNMYGIALKKKGKDKTLAAVLNSAVYALLLEVLGRHLLGQGALALMTYDYEKLPIPNIDALDPHTARKLEDAFDRLARTPAESLFRELGVCDGRDLQRCCGSPSAPSLDRVKPERKNLDEVVLEEVLGVPRSEVPGTLLELYRAVLDLLCARLLRARSVKGKGNPEGDADVEALARVFMEEAGVEPRRFPEDFIDAGDVIPLPKGEAMLSQDLARGIVVRVGDREWAFPWGEEWKAKCIYYAALSGAPRAVIPGDRKAGTAAIAEFEKWLKEATAKLDEFLEEAIPDRKVRDSVRHKLLAIILKRRKQ